jgi:hypothetical protein
MTAVFVRCVYVSLFFLCCILSKELVSSQPCQCVVQPNSSRLVWQVENCFSKFALWYRSQRHTYLHVLSVMDQFWRGECRGAEPLTHPNPTTRILHFSTPTYPNDFVQPGNDFVCDIYSFYLSYKGKRSFNSAVECGIAVHYEYPEVTGSIPVGTFPFCQSFGRDFG